MLLVVTAANLRNVAILGAPGADSSRVIGLFTAQTPARSRLFVGTRHWDAVTITALEASGVPGDEGARRGALRGTDSALFVISAEHGIDAATIAWWAECAALGIPRAIVITQVTAGDFDEALAICQRVFDGEVIALQYPLLDDREHVAGIIDILAMTIHDYSTDEPRTREAEPEHRALLSEAYERVIDALSSQSEPLLHAALTNQTPGDREIQEALRESVCNASISPVLVVERAGNRMVGSEALLDFIARYLPSPSDRTMPPVSKPDGEPCPPLRPEPDEHLCAEILHRFQSTGHAPTNIVRIFSGTLQTRENVLASDSERSATAAAHEIQAAGEQTLRATAGSIVTASGLTDTQVSDTLSEPGYPLVLSAWPLPLALYAVTIEAPGVSVTDRDSVLMDYVAADPLIHMADGVLWCVDESHAQRIADDIRDSLGTPIAVSPATAMTGIHGEDMEPIYRLEVSAPLEFSDMLQADLTRRRAQQISTSREGPARIQLTARVPQSSLQRYPVDLHTLTSGTAHLVLHADGYAPRAKGSSTYR